MEFTSFVLLIFAVAFSKSCVDATGCKPHSAFKIDSDECRCNNDGTEYCCTVKKCEDSNEHKHKEGPDDDEESSGWPDSPNDDTEKETADKEWEYSGDDDTEKESANREGEYSGDDDTEKHKTVKEGTKESPDHSPTRRYVRPGKRYVRPIG